MADKKQEKEQESDQKQPEQQKLEVKVTHEQRHRKDSARYHIHVGGELRHRTKELAEVRRFLGLGSDAKVNVVDNRVKAPK